MFGYDLRNPRHAEFMEYHRRRSRAGGNPYHSAISDGIVGYRLRGNDKNTVGDYGSCSGTRRYACAKASSAIDYFIATNSKASRLGPSIIIARVSPSL